MISADAFIPRRDGTITFDVSGYRYTCRPIRLGEYFTLRSETDYVTDDDLMVGWTVRAVAMLTGWWIRQPPAWFADPDLPVRMIDHWRNWPIPLFDPPKSPDRDPRRTKPPPRSRTYGVYQEVGPIYEALAMRGIGGDVNLLPLWRVAAALGQHKTEEEDNPAARYMQQQSRFATGDPVGPVAPGPTMPTPTNGSFSPLDPQELIRRRVEAAEAGEADPAWGEGEGGIAGGDLLGGLAKA